MIALLAVAGALFGAEPPPAAPSVVQPPELVEGSLNVGVLPGRRDVVRQAVVMVTISAEGAASDVAILQGPTGAGAAALITAIEQARFRPATRDGQALPVRIRWPILLARPAMLRGLDRRAPEPVPVVAQALAGRIFERGTRKPLAGVPILLDGADRSTVTGADGRFGFEDLPKGTYRMIVTTGEHDPVDKTVKVPQRDIVVRLTPNPTLRYRTVLKQPTADAARIVVSMERAREVPGSSGDPLKVIESLPGVARPAAAGPGAGQLSVRGSAPEDTKTYIDGMPLFQLYHFGNIYSVLQDEWIRDVDFRPGGFSVEYGDATGGLLAVTLADVPDDGVHGHLDVNVYHAAALVTAPVGGDWTVGAAFRRSYFDAILPAVLGDDSAISFTTAPRYYDYQVRADYRPSDTTSVRLLAFGSDDLLQVLQDDVADDDPTSDGFKLARRFHQIQGTARTRLTDDLGLYVGLATSYQQFEIYPGGNEFQLTFDPVTLRADLDWTPGKQITVRGGLLGTVLRFNVDAQVPLPTKEGQVALPTAAQEVITATESGLSGQLAGWVEASWRPLPDLNLIGGARLTGYLGNFGAVSVDPRLTVLWDATDTTRVTVAGGLNHQAPTADETSETFGNPELSTERAAYINLGVQQRVGDFLTVDLQGFYKALDNLVSPARLRTGLPYDNAGTGTIVGGELLVRFDSEWVDGWVSYTLSRSRRQDAPGQLERFFSFDQTHVLALVAGVNLGKGWRVGSRFRYATGNPFTPLTTGYFDAAADVYVPRPAADPLAGRIDAFYQLDLRVSKDFTFDAWQLKLYLELNNATNRANVEGVGYNYDYSVREDINSLPITPSLGLRGSF